jgi:hypothetical protein
MFRGSVEEITVLYGSNVGSVRHASLGQLPLLDHWLWRCREGNVWWISKIAGTLLGDVSEIGQAQGFSQTTHMRHQG